MLTKEKFITYIKFPLQALTSRNFYYDVLFKLRGIGLVYLLVLSFVLAIPATYKVNHVIDGFRNLELPNLVASIPPSYISETGALVTEDPNVTYKELKTSKGDTALVYNVNDENINIPLKKDQMLVLLNSRNLTVRVNDQDTAIAYTELFVPGTSFNPVEAANLVDSVFSVAKGIMLVFITLWFFCALVINALFVALVSKAIFLLFGKMKTAFINIVRLSCFANTIFAVMLLVEIMFSIALPYAVIMLLPLIYLVLFIIDFRREIEAHGVENFVARFTPEGTKVRNLDANGNEIKSSVNSSKPDISEYTQGLDSTSNRASQDNRENADNQSEVEDNTDKQNLSENADNNLDTKNNNLGKDTKDKDNGPGFFAP